MGGLDEHSAADFSRMVMENVVREYPNHIMHMLNSDADVQSPRQLHPVFFGCYDWHSSVHSHWLLVRMLRLFPGAAFAGGIQALLAGQFEAGKLAVELAYLEQPNRAGFERPYGLAWLLLLAAELHEWQSPQAGRWHLALLRLVNLAKARLQGWLPKLVYPVRSGEHSQTAFALGLMYDFARITGDLEFAALVETRGRHYFLQDQHAPLAYEPSGHDFLSPALAEADLMRRFLARVEFAEWLGRFLPCIPHSPDADWLQPVASVDPADGKLAHLDGLNLSRAWMCDGIASGLPHGDARRDALLAATAAHAQAGLAGIHAELYAGSHWLPSFAGYLLTRRGICSG
ncbi:MAG: DUF2891 domain-containing protein [Gammaproteobacteria bacterium]|nr:DUF2891 domain-containing protein [Gammaproteobacteria bacterium]MDE2345166.1 DUF2891 domain-containing protein [Gammaproteobacteria bacterium]